LQMVMTKKLSLLILLFAGLGIVKAHAATCGPLTVNGTCYYMSTTGSDGNAGTSSGSPWLTPSHALNCGDAIDAAAGAYNVDNLSGDGNIAWINANCPAGNNVAWLVCATAFACTVSSTSSGIIVTADYWGVMGWVVTQTSNSAYDACFGVQDNTTEVHHVIFANDIANGCYDGGLTAYQTTATESFDYLVLLDDIAYDATQGSTVCGQGITLEGPYASDTQPGTHIYIANDFAWANADPNPCGGGTPSDGSGLYAGPIDGTTTGGVPYNQQIVFQGNISIGNGAPGFEVYQNEVGGVSAPFYVIHNTVWDNTTDSSLEAGTYAEITPEFANNFTIEWNLAATNQSTATGSNYYAFYVLNNGAASTIDYNWGYSAAGYNDGSNNSFVYGSHNVFGTNPSFTSPSIPGAPSCGSYASVPACMATLIANFVPTASGASSYGYQAPSGTSIYDPLFPHWLCANVVPMLISASIPVENGCGGPNPTVMGSFTGPVL
jgi:hypothetical protein